MSEYDRREPPRVERRRTKRMGLRFCIQVTGTDAAGQPFCDRTVTTDVSEEGCRFELLRPVNRGDEIQIRRVPLDAEKPPDGKVLRFMIVRVDASEWGWSVGAEKMQPGNLWRMAFPKLKVPEHSTR